jgi:dynein heavy chain
VPCRFDRQKLTQKNINNTQYVACMNPTAGSFTINPRLQRLFFTLAVGFPGQDSLMKIYGTFLQVGGASMHVPAAVCHISLPVAAHCSKAHQPCEFCCKIKQHVVLSYGFLCSLQGHLKRFKEEIQEMGTKILQAALALHDRVSSTFRKTAVNFHYE